MMVVFYVYNLKNNQKVSEFNPSPRSAQYFGMHASRSGDVVCVTQGGATSCQLACTRIGYFLC